MLLGVDSQVTRASVIGSRSSTSLGLRGQDCRQMGVQTVYRANECFMMCQ
jgi:hypothetical protein